MARRDRRLQSRVPGLAGSVEYECRDAGDDMQARVYTRAAVEDVAKLAKLRWSLPMLGYSEVFDAQMSPLFDAAFEARDLPPLMRGSDMLFFHPSGERVSFDAVGAAEVVFEADEMRDAGRLYAMYERDGDARTGGFDTQLGSNGWAEEPELRFEVGGRAWSVWSTEFAGATNVSLPLTTSDWRGPSPSGPSGDGDKGAA